MLYISEILLKIDNDWGTTIFSGIHISRARLKQQATIQSWGPKNQQPIINSIPTRWCPPSYKLVYNPNSYRYNPLINPSEIVLINQLNANDLGHHLVAILAHNI